MQRHVAEYSGCVLPSFHDATIKFIHRLGPPWQQVQSQAAERCANPARIGLLVFHRVRFPAFRPVTDALARLEGAVNPQSTFTAVSGNRVLAPCSSRKHEISERRCWIRIDVLLYDNQSARLNA